MTACACGCGTLVRRRFAHGHNSRVAHPRWKGGRFCRNGYVHVKAPGHPNADHAGYVREHILVVEQAMGKVLRVSAEVHHVNNEKADNGPSNLVACEDHAYHMLLHRRQRAFDECGHADWSYCVFCKSWDAPETMVHAVKVTRSHHLECRRRYQVAQRRAA